MKVIKHGKNYIRYGKCDCGCEFEYDRKDVKAYKIEYKTNNAFCTYSCEVDAKKYELKNKNIHFYVICPECGNRVSVEREI